MSSKLRRALLDTSVLIDPPSPQQVSEYADELAVSVIAIGELQQASRHGLLLLTRNASDFIGLESALTVVGLPHRH